MIGSDEPVGELSPNSQGKQAPTDLVSVEPGLLHYESSRRVLRPSPASLPACGQGGGGGAEELGRRACVVHKHRSTGASPMPMR